MKQRIVRHGGLVLAALLVLTIAVFGLAGVAQAQTRTVEDGPGPDRQTPAYRLTKGTFTYTAERTVLRAHVQRLVKKRTWVGAHVYYPGDASLWLRTFHRKNGTKVVSAVYSSGDTTHRLRANARWNYKRDTVTIVVNNARQDPRPGNRRATLDLYTVTKGWQHGPSCDEAGVTARAHTSARTVPVVGAPPTVVGDDCNDDYVATRLRR